MGLKVRRTGGVAWMVPCPFPYTIHLLDIRGIDDRHKSAFYLEVAVMTLLSSFWNRNWVMTGARHAHFGSGPGAKEVGGWRGAGEGRWVGTWERSGPSSTRD